MRTFSLSPSTISFCIVINCGISQVQLIYLPASQSRFSFARKTMVSAANSGVSTNTSQKSTQHSLIMEGLVLGQYSRLTMLKPFRNAATSIKNFGCDGSWVYTIRQHSLISVLGHDEFPKSQQRQLAGLIGTKSWHDGVRSNATCVDDLLVSFQEQWKECAGREVRSANIDDPGIPPFLGVTVGNGTDWLDYASVVDEDIQLAEFLSHLGGCVVYAFLVGHIQDYR